MYKKIGNILSVYAADPRGIEKFFARNIWANHIWAVFIQML